MFLWVSSPGTRGARTGTNRAAGVLWAGMKPRNPAAGNDPLVDLQLRVARRADAIATGQSKMPGLDLHCWLVAEREVFGGDSSKPTTTPKPELVVDPVHR